MSFTHCLRSAPQSLAALSLEHRDGWGAAVGSDVGAWRIEKRAACAGDDALFASIAEETEGIALVAHVRARTVGAISQANTHPFRRGRWVFAHNGTIEDVGFLAAHTSPLRGREREGETDSEQLLAFLLSRLDEHGLSDAAATANTDDVIGAAVDDAIRHGIGSLNFVLSDGATLYANRAGRSLHVLERAAAHGRPGAFLVASEAITTEQWLAVDDATLVRCRRSTIFDVRCLRGRDPRPRVSSDVELPFTD
jgi:glutamine amidotransferase